MDYLDKVKAKIEETQTKYEKLGYPRIKIEAQVIKLGRGVSGMATWFTDKTKPGIVKISPDYLREHEEQVLNRTVPHEVTHLYQKFYFPSAKQSHGPEFRAMMGMIGADGSTRHSMVLSDAKPRRRNAKVRWVYITTKSRKEIFLTKQQHSDQQLGRRKYTAKNGELIAYTGKQKTFY